MACSPMSLRCMKNSYIEIESKDVLFSGLVITEGTSVTYLKSPYSVTFSGDMAVIVDAEKKSYSLRLSSVKQSKNALKALLADCNCCAGDDEVGNRNSLVKDESELPLNPSQGDIALFEDEPRIDIFDGVAWQTVNLNKITTLTYNQYGLVEYISEDDTKTNFLALPPKDLVFNSDAEAAASNVGIKMPYWAGEQHIVHVWGALVMRVE